MSHVYVGRVRSRVRVRGWSSAVRQFLTQWPRERRERRGIKQFKNRVYFRYGFGRAAITGVPDRACTPITLAPGTSSGQLWIVQVTTRPQRQERRFWSSTPP